MRNLTRASFVLPALIIAASGSLHAQEPGGTPIPIDEMAWLMERYAELAAPGPAHQRLEAFVGEWSTTTKVWLAGPGSEPAASAGTSEIEWILGGRFLVERSEGVVEGQEIEGFGLVGYDNLEERYDAVWVDSGNTGMYRSDGEWSDELEGLVLSGERTDPMTGEIARFEYVRRVIDEDRFVFEIHDLSLGAKVVEVEYERD